MTFTYNAVRSEWVNHCSSRLTVSQNVVYRYYVVGSEWVNLIRSPISLLLSMKVQQSHTHTNTVGSGQNGLITFQSYLFLSVSLKLVKVLQSDTQILWAQVKMG